MSQSTTYTSRTGEIPCGDMDLYAFLTDLRNFRELLPYEIKSEWKASADKCSFRVEKAGRVTVRLGEALPHSMVSYEAESLFTGKVLVQIKIEYITNVRSKFYIISTIKLNPFVKMIIGDAAPKYLDILIDEIENYKGYDKIRGCNQSL
ncbi:MAG: hypothetical protein WCD55_09935 [Bacteroidales bacterium]